MWHSGVCFKRRYVMVYGIFAFFGICRPFSVDSPAKTERVWLFKVPIKERNVPLLISVIIIIALTGLDQLTKHLATVYLAPVGAMPFIPGVMELRYVLNDGAAFSMLADAEWGRVFLIVVTGLAQSDRPCAQRVCGRFLCYHIHEFRCIQCGGLLCVRWRRVVCHRRAASGAERQKGAEGRDG